MKKILIIFLGIFSLLIINGGYSSIKEDTNSFYSIENQVFNKENFVENGVKVEYYTNLTKKQENEKIINLIKDKFGVDVLDKGNNIKANIKSIKIDISIYCVDNNIKVELILLNNDSNIKTDKLLDIANVIKGNEYTNARVFQFVKGKIDCVTESIPKSIIENSKQDTMRSLEINNGKVSNIVMKDDKSINVAQVNYNSGSYLIIGTPTIFITY